MALDVSWSRVLQAGVFHGLLQSVHGSVEVMDLKRKNRQIAMMT